MIAADTALLIEIVEEVLAVREGAVLTDDAIEDLATNIAGALRGRFLIARLPTVDEEATSRAEVAAMGLGLFEHS